MRKAHPVALVAGRAVFQAELPVGPHTVTALYTGDGTFGSSSGLLSEDVTVVNATDLQQVVSQGNPVTIQANVPSDVDDLVAAVDALNPTPEARLQFR